MGPRFLRLNIVVNGLCVYLLMRYGAYFSPMALGIKPSFRRMEERSDEQGFNIHKIGEIVGHVGLSSQYV